MRSEAGDAVATLPPTTAAARTARPANLRSWKASAEAAPEEREAPLAASKRSSSVAPAPIERWPSPAGASPPPATPKSSSDSSGTLDMSILTACLAPFCAHSIPTSVLPPTRVQGEPREEALEARRRSSERSDVGRCHSTPPPLSFSSLSPLGAAGKWSSGLERVRSSRGRRVEASMMLRGDDGRGEGGAASSSPESLAGGANFPPSPSFLSSPSSKKGLKASMIGL